MSRDEPIEQERAETRQVERRDGTESPGETTSRDDRPGRQAGRDGRSDELMRTAREEINCHLPGIRPCQGVVWPVSFLVSPHRLVFRLVPCLLACRLRFISSSHPVSRYHLVPRLVYPSRRASRAFPVPSFLVACLSSVSFPFPSHRLVGLLVVSSRGASRFIPLRLRPGFRLVRFFLLRMMG